MPTEKNILRYHVASMASLQDRKNLQKSPRSKWEFRFTAYDARVFLTDKVEIKEVKLHSGLDIIIVLEGAYSEGIVEIGNSLAERILDIICFTTLAQCNTPRLISHIILKDNNTANGYFMTQQDSENDIIIGTPRKINEDIFKAIWKACDSYKYEERILRALSWFRKSIREKYYIDQFISFFVSIEVIKPILRDILKQKMKNPGEWDGIKNIFNNKIKSIKFEDVNLARNELLHGYKPLSQEFTARILSYIKPLRDSIVYGIGDILELPDTSMDVITGYAQRRLFTDSSIGLKGSFKNLPNDIEEIFKKYPEFIFTRKPNRYSLLDTGELDISLSGDHLATLPEKTVFNVESMMVIGEENAGVVPFKAELQNK